MNNLCDTCENKPCDCAGAKMGYEYGYKDEERHDQVYRCNRWTGRIEHLFLIVANIEDALDYRHTFLDEIPKRTADEGMFTYQARVRCLARREACKQLADLMTVALKNRISESIT